MLPIGILGWPDWIFVNSASKMSTIMLKKMGRRAFSAAAPGSRVLVWGNGDSGQLGLGELKMEGVAFKHYDGIEAQLYPYTHTELSSVGD